MLNQIATGVIADLKSANRWDYNIFYTKRPGGRNTQKAKVFSSKQGPIIIEILDSLREVTVTFGLYAPHCSKYGLADEIRDVTVFSSTAVTSSITLVKFSCLCPT